MGKVFCVAVGVMEPERMNRPSFCLGVVMLGEVVRSYLRIREVEAKIEEYKRRSSSEVVLREKDSELRERERK